MIKNIPIEVHHPHACITHPSCSSLQQLKETRKQLLIKYIQSQKHLLPQSASTQHRLFQTALDLQNVQNGLNSAISKGNVIRNLQNLQNMQNGKNCQSLVNVHDKINNLNLKNVQNLQKVQNLQNIQNFQIVQSFQNNQNLQSKRINHTNAQNLLNVKNQIFVNGLSW